MAKSIIQNNKFCIICGNTINLEEHHCLFGKNRKKAEQDGLKVWLCVEHHRGTNGVHGRDGKKLDIYLKMMAEMCWLDTYNKTTDDFIKRYGKNYLYYKTDDFWKEIKIEKFESEKGEI